MTPPRLIPDSMDDLVEQRWDATEMAEHIVHGSEHQYRLAALSLRWADRLTARINMETLK